LSENSKGSFFKFKRTGELTYVVQSLHTTTSRIFYPSLVAVSQKRYRMSWTCAKEGHKTGRILEKKAVCWKTESLAGYHTSETTAKRRFHRNL